MRKQSLLFFSIVSLFLAGFTSLRVSKALQSATSPQITLYRAAVEEFSSSDPGLKPPSETVSSVQDRTVIQLLDSTPTVLTSHSQFHPQTLSTPSALLYEDVPTLETFRLSVSSGESDQITGIWVDGLMAFEIVQGNGNFVPSKPNTAATYEWATAHGVTALLIHNHLGGTRIYDLETGVMIAIIYGDGSLTWYVAEEGTRYEAQNYSLEGFAGPFRSWTCTDCEFDLSVSDLRRRHYAGPHHLALQTCIQADGRVGLLIIEAQPAGLN
jgi:hypothetical protein